VACFSELVADAPAALKPKLQGNLDFAIQHQAIIARFGRFPYRNAVLGRASTAEENGFLRDGPRFGHQAAQALVFISHAGNAPSVIQRSVLPPSLLPCGLLDRTTTT
jgi:hypothetical protein